MSKSSRQKNPKVLFGYLLIILGSVSCVNQKLAQKYCEGLKRVRPDDEGYFSRVEVLDAVGYQEGSLSGGLLNGGEGIWLDGHFYLGMSHQGYDFNRISTKTIDEILDNPDRTRSGGDSQLDSVVLVNRRNQEVCRITARTK